MRETMILAGDIGGTHTRLALFHKSGDLVIRNEKKYLSRSYRSLAEIVRQFLGEGETVHGACFGVAGAVRNGRCQATNLPWVIDTADLEKELKIPTVHLINDLEANAYGIQVLPSKELSVIHAGQNQTGNQALIAAGTGLGEAGLYWDGKKHHPFACEGGHADFAPRNQEEFELMLFLKKRYEHVSYERVVSGPGIVAIYQFLIESGRQESSKEIGEEMKERDPAAVISERAEKDQACAVAIDWFISLYGAEAGNLALKFLALGGFYIGGGIAPHLVDRMKKGFFHSSFVDKGRFADLLSSIPVYLILNPNTALLGSAAFARGL